VDGLLNMNYKKGLTRIFIIGLFIAPLFGLFQEGESITKVQTIIWDVENSIVSKLSDPACLAIVKANPKNFSDIDTKHNCFPLSGYWDVIKAYQAKSGNNEQVNDRIIEQAMEAYIDTKVFKLRMEAMGLYLGGYLALCLLGLIGFFIIRWVIRGFKSQ
jgi:hypothetical protein